MKKILLVLTLLVLGFGITFLITSSKDNPEGNIVMGYIGPLTGPSAVLGMDAIKAIEIAVAETNDRGGVRGRKITLIAEDDQYLTKTTVTAYDKLVHVDKAKVILVSTYGGVLALKDRAIKDDVIILNPLDCNSDIADSSKNIFCLATETESIGRSLAEEMLRTGKTRAAVMYSTKDVFMSLVNDAFAEKFSKGGGQIVTESFNYDEGDFRTQLSKIKVFNADGIVILGHDETGLIMKQAREIGISAPFFATGTITSPSAQEASKGAAEKTIFAYWESNPENTVAQEFEAKFVKSVGRGPILPLTTHPAYDAVKILLNEVLQDTKNPYSTKEIKEELLAIKNYAGVTGIVTFDIDGGARIPETVFQLIDGMPKKI